MQTLSNPEQQTDLLIVAETSPARPATLPALSARSLLLLQSLLLLSALLLYAVHFVHLSADFPNFSRWMDWSKYTDEGWYGDAAIRFYQLGHWYVPGDFNPAVALPVWPVLEAMLFRFTGVSLVAERALTVAVFGFILASAWWLIAAPFPASRDALRGEQGRHVPRLQSGGALAASTAVLLLAANPFCFVFTRMGILEPLLVLLMLLALLTARHANVAPRMLRANLPVILGLGTLLPLIVLTKTTGLFLVPAIAAMLFFALECRVRQFLLVGVPSAVLGMTLWLAYFLLVVRPHFLLDYRYLFSANAYTGINRTNFFATIFWTIHGGAWMGRTLFCTVLAALLVAAFHLRRLRAHPMVAVLILWAAGYAAFLAYHNNLQPRYYLVIVVPVTLLVPVVFRELIFHNMHTPSRRLTALVSAAILFALILLPDARETLHFVRHPQYTFVSAASHLAAYIRAEQRRDPAHSPLVLSISGSDLSLMTGLHSICDDFGTLELADRVKRYRPGWYVAWNLIEDDKMDALTPLDHVTRVATFPAMDDQDRNQLILYRLDAAEAGEQPHHRGRRLRNRTGQQPSSIQLGH